MLKKQQNTTNTENAKEIITNTKHIIKISKKKLENDKKTKQQK